MKIRTVIADDMPLARRRIKRYLAADSEIEVIAECANGSEAVEAIRNFKPDLLFLDVQMPELDGFEVLAEIGPDQMPAVVFVTAFDEFALKAFEVNAVDYLLKPFDHERFRRTLARVKLEITQRSKTFEERLSVLLSEVKAKPKYLKRLVVKSSGRTIVLLTAEIDYIEAAGNYLRIRIGKSEYLIRDRLSSLESKLDPEKFVRIHRSTIVNVERIKEMHPLFNGDQMLVLDKGTQLTLSRSYRDKFLSLLE